MVTGQNGKWTCAKHGDFAEMPPTYLNGTLNGAQQMPWPECPACVALQKNDICRECEKHPATVSFANDSMSFIHGMTERICLCCHVARVEKHLEETIEGLARVKAELAAHPCDPYAPEAL